MNQRRMRVKKSNNIRLPFFYFLAAFLFLVSCKNDYYPKPRGYFRIDLPEKVYLDFDTTFPYSFEYPTYARIISNKNSNANPYWINLEFPEFRGTLHLSYKPISGNLAEYLEDTRKMVMKHIPKTSGIENRVYENSENKVYGLTYNIGGTAAASPFQFYLTDSTTHFVRGALYFSVVPNNDSLAPIIEFLKEDINHMIETFKWR